MNRGPRTSRLPPLSSARPDQISRRLGNTFHSSHFLFLVAAVFETAMQNSVVLYFCPSTLAGLSPRCETLVASVAPLLCWPDPPAARAEEGSRADIVRSRENSSVLVSPSARPSFGL